MLFILHQPIKQLKENTQFCVLFQLRISNPQYGIFDPIGSVVNTKKSKNQFYKNISNLELYIPIWGYYKLLVIYFS